MKDKFNFISGTVMNILALFFQGRPLYCNLKVKK